ncbi:MAG: HEAT repeat domain-containing protein [Merismopedia sp. SIO2A8]|nr:HEAT repeat domain-containing protein [Merismopedia sp. SIO2A8]
MTPPTPTAAELIRAVEKASSAQALTDAVRDLADATVEDAIPILIEALGYNNPGAAVAAVDGLVALGDVVVPILLQQIDGYNYGARAWAVRALASIGHPDAIETLLHTLETDFSMSVRRAAARGLGMLRWQELPHADIESAQARALATLLPMAQDPEWIVRYATVVGLQALAIAVPPTRSDWHAQIHDCFAQMRSEDDTLVVRTRVRRAQQIVNAFIESQLKGIDGTGSPEWQQVLEKLYQRKANERPLEEGDPRRFKTVAATLSPTQSS